MVVPVVLFVYKRQDKLVRTLDCLRQNSIPRLIVYSDGPRGPADMDGVANVRRVLDRIDWCEVERNDRETNLGLGRSILYGAGKVFREYGRAIIMEDDIESAPAMYRFATNALEHYADDSRVTSISLYSNPRLRPDIGQGVPGEPYFCGRYCCWGWAAWRRSWAGMNMQARWLAWLCRMAGIDVNKYGSDISEAARMEKRRNLWAARFALVQYLRHGLSLYPYESLTNHMGFEDSSTSQGCDNPVWGVKLADDMFELPKSWPEPKEYLSMPSKFQALHGVPLAPHSALSRDIRALKWRMETWMSKQKRSN